MQIILQQRNIEAALKQYIASQGINLTGKSVAVEFTAGRKETGISAAIDIEDATEGQVVQPLGNVTPLAVHVVEASTETPEQDASVETKEDPAPVTPANPAPVGASLFN